MYIIYNNVIKIFLQKLHVLKIKGCLRHNKAQSSALEANGYESKQQTRLHTGNIA